MWNSVLCRKGTTRGVPCKAAQLPGSRAPRLPGGHNAPPQLETGKRKTPQQIQIQPQSVKLQRARPNSSQTKYNQARHRLTVALMEEDVDAAIDAVSEARAISTLECLPSAPSSFPRHGPAHGSETFKAREGQQELSPPTSASSAESAVSATAAFAKREHSESVARQLSIALGGLHARFIRMCLRSSKPQVAFNYVVLLPTSEKMHGSLMNEISKHGSKQQVEAALELRVLFQLPMDKFTLSAALSKFSDECSAHEVHALYQQHRNDPSMPLDSHVFNAVLSAHAAAGDTEQFSSIWSDMREAGCSPTPASHACRVKLLLAAQGSTAVLEYYREIVGKKSDSAQRARAACMLSPHLYTSVFVAVATGIKEGVPVKFSTLWTMWRDMVEFGIPLDDQLASSFLAAAKGMVLTPREVETCFGVLSTLRANRLKPGVGVLCNMLQLCARNDTSARVLDIWALVEADRLRVTPHVLSAALACCARCVQECPEVLQLAMRLEKQLRERWIDTTLWRRCPTAETNFRVAFNALLAYHAAAERFDHGLATWQFMKESGPKPNQESFCAMLHVCGSTGKAADAQSMLSEMYAAGTKPDIKAFCGVLDACAKAKDVHRAREVLQSMPLHGVAPNVVAYTCMMDACVREGSASSLAQVAGIMGTMHDAGMQPSAVTYGCALAACEASQDADQAFKLYHEACEAGVIPTDNLHNALIKVCVSVGKLDDALEQIKNLIRAHGHMQQHTINSLTRALSDQYIDRALYMLRFMRRGKITPSHKTYHALIAGCARESMPDVGLSLYVEMRTCGHLPSSRSGSPLIEALSHAGRLEAALLVLRDMARCAEGLGTAVAAALSALGEQPEDGRIYGAPTLVQGSGRYHAAQQLQQLTASLPQLELSYRTEGDEELQLPGSTGASVTTGDPGKRRPEHDTLSHSAHTDKSPASKMQTASSSSSLNDVAGKNKRDWGWPGTARVRASSIQPGVDEKHSTRNNAQRFSPTAKRGGKKSQQKQKRKHHALRKSDMLPTIEAVAAIVLGMCLANEGKLAVQLYGQLRRQGSAALSGLLIRGSRVFELLMEGFCRSGRVHEALSIFDDWKAAREALLHHHLHNSNSENLGEREQFGSEGAAGRGGLFRLPKLSNVTLAYLEASCHACSDQEDVRWRVYDVCAVMRQQQEDKKSNKLLRPKKGSHHVKEAL